MNRIEKLQEFLILQPNDSFLKHALALEYVKLNNDEGAKVLFEEILEIEPSYIGTYYHLAKLYERHNLKEEAIKAYEEGMKQAKALNDNHAYNELRMSYDDYIDD